MFTGIVTAVGTVTRVERDGATLGLVIEAPYADLVPGESIAVGGACLTVVDTGDGRFRVDVITTTRDRTRLAELEPGARVNLERAMQVGDRLGGHLVQGHVDGLGEVGEVGEDGGVGAAMLRIRVPPDVAEVTVPRGSITVDGVSLTVSAVPEPGLVEVALIPYTREFTTLGDVRPGDRVHVEGDLIGKYVKNLMEGVRGQGGGDARS